MTHQESLDKTKLMFWRALTTFLVLATVATALMIPALMRYKQSLWPSRVLNVSAEGKTVVTPDLAEISLSVVSRGQNPESLADQNNKKMTAVIDNLKANGVEAKDIKTSGYQLSPDYQYDQDSQRSFITGYTMTQTVSVKIRKIADVAKILGGVTPLGVNQIGGVNFTVEDPDKYLAEARRDAFEKAKKKAMEIANASGISLGEVTGVSESSGGYPVPYMYDKGAMGMGGAMERMAVAAPTIEAGTQEIRLQVSLTYEIR